MFSLTTDLCQQQPVISYWVVNANDTPNYSIKKNPTLLDFSSLDGTVCYTANWLTVGMIIMRQLSSDVLHPRGCRNISEYLHISICTSPNYGEYPVLSSYGKWFWHKLSKYGCLFRSGDPIDKLSRDSLRFYLCSVILVLKVDQSQT